MNKTNQERFLAAANWALLHERAGKDVGINIRRMKTHTTDGRNVVIFNGSKGLMYTGYTHREQELLKGLIVEEHDNRAVSVLAACFPKFYNLGEPSEKKSYCKFVKRKGVDVYFYVKEDGTNIRPYWNAASNQVEFATRSMLTGFTDEDFNFNFGEAAREIAAAKYPILLDKNFVSEFSLVFELIHPGSRVITNYGDTEDLILLAGFDLVEGCRELTRYELHEMASTIKFNLVDHYGRVPNSQFDETLETLRTVWAGSDREGTVATFVRNKDGTPLYRLKIKNKEYLDMLRLSRYCTLKRTREVIEENGYTTWDQLREKLYQNTAMNEELEMAYKAHWDTYQAWLCAVEDHIGYVVVSVYEELPPLETQKEFALYVLSHDFFKPHAPFLFEIHKSVQNGTDPFSSEKLVTMAQKLIPLGDEENESEES